MVVVVVVVMDPYLGALLLPLGTCTCNFHFSLIILILVFYFFFLRGGGIRGKISMAYTMAEIGRMDRSGASHSVHDFS